MTFCDALKKFISDKANKEMKSMYSYDKEAEGVEGVLIPVPKYGEKLTEQFNESRKTMKPNFTLLPIYYASKVIQDNSRRKHYEGKWFAYFSGQNSRFLADDDYYRWSNELPTSPSRRRSDPSFISLKIWYRIYEEIGEPELANLCKSLILTTDQVNLHQVADDLDGQFMAAIKMSKSYSKELARKGEEGIYNWTLQLNKLKVVRFVSLETDFKDMTKISKVVQESIDKATSFEEKIEKFKVKRADDIKKENKIRMDYSMNYVKLEQLGTKIMKEKYKDIAESLETAASLKTII